MSKTTEQAVAPRDDKAIVTEMTNHLLKLIARADTGDDAALADLKAALDEAPALTRSISGLGQNAEWSVLRAMLSNAPKQDAGSFELFARQLDAMRKELRGAEPTPLERLLVDRLVLDWLFANYQDTRYAQKLNGSISISEAEYWQRGRERAHRQVTRAAHTLATVRRLVAPSVQVNIADKQINVSG